MKADIIRPTAVLVLVTLFAAVIIGVTYTVTREPIRAQRANAEMAAILALLPDTHEIYYFHIDEPGSSLTRATISLGPNGETTGYVLSASPAGYSGRIHMMIAFDPYGIIQGVRIINHTETPGLGANITQDWFLGGFAGRGPAGVLAIHDVPAIASATISVNAVLRGVNDALAFMRPGEELLLSW
ncbi:MAG: RnfABCDGE type electron transport complex subunit G [Defluviitaleaceae bacterium]|nr:RnfABCDGE type electron transport complex subunit G [Defluviitaleaceae bacterium]MCL2239694.1 RnfABCDGE type electron transport complex subunit G [Defluviitaleaceae bacterium]